MTASRWEIGTEEPEDLRALIEAERREKQPSGRHRTSHVAPRSATEEAIADVFAQVLRLDRVGVKDDFFALGGQSLLATQVIAKVRTALRVDAHLEWILDAPTVEKLAERVEAAVTEGRVSLEEVAPLPQVEAAAEARYEPFPLTDIQQAYWLGRDKAFELGNISTHVYLEFEKSGIDVAKLERAWQRLVERHDMLRAVVDPTGLQRVLKEVPPYRIQVANLTGGTDGEAATGVEKTRGEMSHQVFATEKWPLFDVRASLLPGGKVRTHFSIDVLIVNAGSFALLFREWEQLYLDPDAQLPPLDVTFRDYILAAAKVVPTLPYRKSSEYWSARLATLPSAPQLPLAKSPRSVVSPRFVRRMGRMEEEAWTRLKARAAAVEVTPSMLLATVFGDVLAAWSRTPHFTLNLTLYNRLPLHPQVESIVGDFTSSTLLEMKVPAGEDFTTRARRVQKQMWSDIDHRYMSGVEVLRESARRQSAAVMMPVVLTSMLGLNVPMSGRSSLLGTEVHGISQTTQVSLDHIALDEEGGALRYTWDAVEELFPPGMLDAMFEVYRQRLEDLAAAADGAWDTRLLPSLPERQREDYARWNATEAAIEPGLLHSSFKEHARRDPGRIAIISASRTLRYGEAASEARRLGRLLRGAGVKPNELVAIVMNRGWEQVVAALGVLESGAAYVPIDADLPPERRLHLLARCATRFVLTQRRVDEKGPWPDDVERVCVDGGLDGLSDKPMAPAQRETDLAYVIFTSGSTGTPKGVMVEHQGALNTVRDVNERHGVGAEDRILSLSSLSFDLSVYDIFGALGVGGAIVLLAPGETRDPKRWAELVSRNRVTVWNTVPALMQMLLEHLEAGDKPSKPEEHPLRSLRLAFFSGDWVPLGLADRLKAQVAGLRVISMGGATEASIWSIDYPIAQVEPTWPSIPYGKPMKNQRFFVLGEGLQPRPVWVPGELYIGGVGLARGYWRDEAKTNERFVLHPETAERIYRTGDWGRYLADGNIEFLGREDGQVKIRGFRVELGEIDAAITALPEVREAVCATYADVSGQKSLVAYVVRAPGAKVDDAAIRSKLAAKLPDYMVPPQVMFLEALPLSANGKVDRKALPSPTAVATAAQTYAAPRTPREQTMATIWQELLHRERVGLTDNFFALGGNSLIAVMLVGRAQRELGLELPLAKVLEHPTIESLLGSSAAATPKGRHLITLNRGDSRPPLVVVSGLGGYGFVFQGLAKFLGDEQRVHVLNAIGAEDESEGFDHTIEEMATIYEPQIMAACAEGPVIIGGYSFGMLVAYEIAHRLKLRGRSIPLLVCFDGFAPCFPELLPLGQRLRSHLKALASGDESERRLYLRTRLTRLKERFYGTLGRPEEAEARVPFADASTDLRLRKLAVGLTKAGRLYRPDYKVESDLLLIKTSIPERWVGAAMEDPLYGWESWTTGRIELVTVPGEHLTLFEERNQRSMAEVVSGAIDRAIAG